MLDTGLPPLYTNFLSWSPNVQNTWDISLRHAVHMLQMLQFVSAAPDLGWARQR